VKIQNATRHALLDEVSRQFADMFGLGGPVADPPDNGGNYVGPFETPTSNSHSGDDAGSWPEHRDFPLDAMGFGDLETDDENDSMPPFVTLLITTTPRTPETPKKRRGLFPRARS
jgi:hypothetical protein